MKFTSPNGIEHSVKTINYESQKDYFKEIKTKITEKLYSIVEGMNSNVYYAEDGKICMARVDEFLIFENKDSFLAYSNMVGIAQRRKLIDNKLPYQIIEYLPGGELIYCLFLDKFYGDVIAASYPQIKSKYTLNPLYQNDKLEVIETFPTNPQKKYLLYPNLESFNKVKEKRFLISTYLKEFRKGKINQYEYNYHMMCGRNPFGEDFLKNKDYLIEELPKLLGIPSNLIRLEKKNISKVEDYFYRRNITAEFSNNIFLPLLAYIGEVFIQNESGEWRISYSESLKTWIPDVYIKDTPKQFWIPLLKALNPYDTQYYPFILAYNHKVRVSRSNNG